MAYANKLKAQQTSEGRGYYQNVSAEEYNLVLPYCGHKRISQHVRPSKLARITRLHKYMLRAFS